MCGRYFITKAPRGIRRDLIPDDFSESRINPFLLKPRYNIAPTQMGPVFRLIDGQLHGGELRWGFRPQWMKEPGRYQINARAETVFEKPMFRAAARSQRCLVLASGWYEWQQAVSDKQPWAFHMKDYRPFFMAGLWTAGRDDANLLHENFLILTTAANEHITHIHNRMPVILDGEGCKAWLDPAADSGELTGLLCPFNSPELEARRVSKAVNSPRNDSADCIAPLTG